MKKSELFDTLMNKVCEVCEVCSTDIIRGCRSQNVVDARMLLVQYLRKGGLSNDDIARIFIRKVTGDTAPPMDVVKRKAKNIDRLYNEYMYRNNESHIFSLMSDDINSFCREFYNQSAIQLCIA